MDRSFRQLQLLEAWRRITVGACHPCDHAPQCPPPATRPAPAIRSAIRGGLDRGHLLVTVTHGFPVFGHSRRLPAWGPNRHRFSRCTTPPRDYSSWWMWNNTSLFRSQLLRINGFLTTPDCRTRSTANSQPKRPGRPVIAHHRIRPSPSRAELMIRDQHGRHTTSGEANSNTHHPHQPYRILASPAA